MYCPRRYDNWIIFRDWLLITGKGVLQTGEGHVKFYPYEKGGGGVDFF